MSSLEMMRCDRRELTLTKKGCGRLWESAQAKHADKTLQPWEGIATCHTCPIGAANAGKPMEAVFQPAAALACICPRCDQPAARLINKRLCISCYNRDREALVGKDAKGNRPKLCDQLHDERIVVYGAERREIRVKRVLNRTEALILVARDLSAGSSIGFVPPVWISPQLMLPFGAAA